MKRLFLSLSISMLGSSLVAMEPKQPVIEPIAAQTAQERLLTIIAADGSEHTMPGKDAEAPKTIDYQIEDTCGGEIHLPDIKDKKHMEKHSTHQIHYSFIEEGENPFMPETISYCFKALHENHCVGSLSYCVNPQTRTAYINEVSVQENYRQKKIGFNLCNLTIQRIANSCGSIKWEAVPFDNVSLTALVHIYKKIANKLGSQYELSMDYSQNNSKLGIPMKLTRKRSTNT